MVTESEYRVNGKYMGAVTLYGLSTYSKPTHVGNGSKFIEIDNVGKIDEETNLPVNYKFYFDAENSTWYPVADAPESEAKSITRTAKSTSKK